jgi:hypothetical protein
MSAVGTTRTFRNVRYSVAMGWKADIIGSLRAFPLLTQRWGNRPAFLWIAEDLGCCASG